MEPLDVRFVAETLRDPPPTPPVLIDGMVRQGELCVIGAPRAIGKSWLAMNIAALVARGDDYVFGTLQVRHAVPVLLCHGETTPWMAASRWATLLGGTDPGPLAECFDPWHLSVVRTRHTTRTDDGESVSEDAMEGRLDRRLSDAVAEHGIGLLVVDPWASFYCGAESSNDEVEAALGQLRELSASTGVAVVIVHHVGKATWSRDPEDLWRGASRLADAASTRVTLLRKYTDDEALQLGLKLIEARRYVSVRFLRRERPTPDFTAVLGEDGWWCRVQEGDLLASPPRKASDRVTPEEVAVALRVDGGRWDSLSAAMTALGLSKEATRTALERAVSARLVSEERGRAGARSFVLAPPSTDEQGAQALVREGFGLDPDDESDQEI